MHEDESTRPAAGEKQNRRHVKSSCFDFRMGGAFGSCRDMINSGGGDHLQRTLKMGFPAGLFMGRKNVQGAKCSTDERSVLSSRSVAAVFFFNCSGYSAVHALGLACPRIFCFSPFEFYLHSPPRFPG